MLASVTLGWSTVVPRWILSLNELQDLKGPKVQHNFIYNSLEVSFDSIGIAILFMENRVINFRGLVWGGHLKGTV